MPRIICIDDERDFRQSLAEYMRQEGFSVDEAADGEEGLKKIAASDYDLVICDVSMPGKTGFDVLSELRAYHPKKAGAPFIFLTAFGQKDKQMKAHSLGADNYLVKPVDFDLLASMVKAKLAYSKALSELMKSEKESSKTNMLNLLNDELKNPLNVIIGLSDLIRHEAFGRLLNDKYREFVERIGQASIRLHSLVENAMESTAIRAGKVYLSMEDVDTESVVMDAVASICEFNEEEEKKFDVKVKAGAIKADSQYLKKAMYILLSEARNCLKDGEKVAVAVSSAPQDIVEFSVGAGEAGNLARISTSDFGGISLQLVEDIMELHGGEFTVETGPSGEISFRCLVPVHAGVARLKKAG